jgi:hypothetical protein
MYRAVVWFQQALVLAQAAQPEPGREAMKKPIQWPVKKTRMKQFE